VTVARSALTSGRPAAIARARSRRGVVIRRERIAVYRLAFNETPVRATAGLRRLWGLG
jgi:hypothetical protein